MDRASLLRVPLPAPLSARRSLLSLLCFGQPPPAQLLYRDTRHVGFEVEDRGPIEHVDAADVESWTLAAQQLDDREPDRIRPSWRTRCEDAVGHVIDRRPTDEIESLGPIEDPQHEEVRKALYVFQSGLEHGQDIEDTFEVVFRAEPLGNGGGFRVRAPNISDGLRYEHVLRLHGPYYAWIEQNCRTPFAQT